MMLGRWKTVPVSGVLACVVVVGLAVWAAIGSPASGHGDAAAPEHGAAAACLQRPQRAVIAHSGPQEPRRWRIVGLLRNNGRCHSRTLEANFLPFLGAGPSWNYGHEVSVGGSLSPSFVIASQVLEGPGAVSFSGITSRRSAVVEFTTGNGVWSKVTPEEPGASVLGRAGWLRNVRYFLLFLPAGQKLRFVRVRDRSGHVLYRGRESLGGFDDTGFP
jgi:hypothetical protein